MTPIKTTTPNFILFLVLLTMGSCRSLENPIDLTLEETPNELVVECYLEAGKPYRLLLTETKDYFDVANACPFVRDAIVIIKHNGLIDTLQEAPFDSRACSSIKPYWNKDSTRFYNYSSMQTCPHDYHNDFVLEVWDTAHSRYATATTQLLPAVPISNFRTEYNKDSMSDCLIACNDNLTQNNYYRITIHKDRLSKKDTQSIFKYTAENPYLDEVLYDQAIYSNGLIVQTTDYIFYRTDSLIGTIYHIDKAYHDYLLTSQEAINSNLTPFTQPTAISSNISGGNGIFTGLSYDRDTVYIPW